MKTLRRNKRKFWYCLFEGEEPLLDEQGRPTTARRIRYSEPIEGYMYVSTSGGQSYNTAAYGQKHVEPFGVDLKYSRTIITEDRTCPIDETSVLFIDKEPEFDSLGMPKYDFYVKRVATSLNYKTIAIERAEVQ